MNISYDSLKIEKQCTENKAMQKLLGSEELADNARYRLDNMKLMPTLLDIKNQVDANLHPLKYDRKGQMAIDVLEGGSRGKWRIVFVPCDGEEVRNDRYNSEKFKTITKVKIIGIIDYH